MKPIPVAFHIGPLEIHTYGIGLAIAFWFGYRYFCYRLEKHGYESSWFTVTFIEIVISAIIGARIVHILAHTRYYYENPGQIMAVWNGGLSSFGGLLGAIPVGFLSARKRYKDLKLSVAADLIAPVLVAAWAVGRLLGPQLMYAGGGKPTTAWYGMYYAGEVGKRLPVPIFQAIECLLVFAISLYVEHLVSRKGGPIGVVTCTATGLWGLSRYFDESVYLPHDNGTIGVEVAGLLMFFGGLVIIAFLLYKYQRSVVKRNAPLLLDGNMSAGSKIQDTNGMSKNPDPWRNSVTPSKAIDEKLPLLADR